MHTCGCHRLCDNRVYQIWRTKFGLSHWLYTQNGLNLFSRWQHSKKMLSRKFQWGIKKVRRQFLSPFKTIKNLFEFYFEII